MKNTAGRRSRQYPRSLDDERDREHDRLAAPDRGVKRWRDGKVILRWKVAAIADAATRFRPVIGAREGMTRLVRALKDHEVWRKERHAEHALTVAVSRGHAA
jgi:hypothetical protein